MLTGVSDRAQGLPRAPRTGYQKNRKDLPTCPLVEGIIFIRNPHFSPLCRSISPFFLSPHQETPSSFRLSSIGEEFLTPGPWPGRKLPHKGDKMARLYRFFFLPYIRDPFLCVCGSDDEEKKRKKKRRKNRTRLLIMRVEEISFCEASTRLFLWKKAFLLYLAPMIIFPFKIFLRDTRNRMETEREHNGHLFSNRIGVIGVATGLRSMGQRKWEEFGTILVFLRILKNINLKKIYFSKAYDYFYPMIQHGRINILIICSYRSINGKIISQHIYIYPDITNI